MGRRGRNQPPLPLEAPVRVRLSDDDRARKGHELSVIGHSIRGHRKKLSTDNSETKKAIAKLEKERAEIEDAIIADEELRAQGQLFVGDGPSKPEAQEALANVAAAAAEVKPSEPHAFALPKPGMPAQATCDFCGADGMDPVHVPRDASETSTPGEVSPEESVAAAKERVTGNGKGPIARARSRTRRPPERKHGKAARP